MAELTIKLTLTFDFDLSNNVRKETRNLGVIFDSELSFDVQCKLYE